jgi:hypothetical protein
VAEAAGRGIKSLLTLTLQHPWRARVGIRARAGAEEAPGRGGGPAGATEAGEVGEKRPGGATEAGRGGPGKVGVREGDPRCGASRVLGQAGMRASCAQRVRGAVVRAGTRLPTRDRLAPSCVTVSSLCVAAVALMHHGCSAPAPDEGHSAPRSAGASACAKRLLAPFLPDALSSQLCLPSRLENVLAHGGNWWLAPEPVRSCLL